MIEMLKNQTCKIIMWYIFFHVQFCVHILNLNVQYDLKSGNGAIQKIRDSMKHIKGLNGRKQL